VSADLVAFLRARLDEDEQQAKACAQVYPPPWDMADRGWIATVRADEPDFRIVTELEQWDAQPDGWLGTVIEHIARHDPARVLAEVDAKRRIIDEYIAADNTYQRLAEDDDDSKWDWLSRSQALETVLPLLALPYADHPSYRAEWRP